MNVNAHFWETHMILYGLPTCSDCKKARKALAEVGHDVTFRDVRAEPMSEADWTPLIAEFGDNLVDKKSQAYRNFCLLYTSPSPRDRG